MIAQIITLKKGESVHGITNHGETPVQVVVDDGYVWLRTTYRNTESVVVSEESAEQE